MQNIGVISLICLAIDALLIKILSQYCIIKIYQSPEKIHFTIRKSGRLTEVGEINAIQFYWFYTSDISFIDQEEENTKAYLYYMLIAEIKRIGKPIIVLKQQLEVYQDLPNFWKYNNERIISAEDAIECYDLIEMKKLFENDYASLIKVANPIFLNKT